LNRGRHLYSAGRPSRWALAHILVLAGCLLSSFVIGATSSDGFIVTLLITLVTLYPLVNVNSTI